MVIVFLPPAKGEFTEAISYYNDQSEGLGYEFAAEVKRTLERIVQYPDAWFKRIYEGEVQIFNYVARAHLPFSKS